MLGGGGGEGGKLLCSLLYKPYVKFRPFKELYIFAR